MSDAAAQASTVDTGSPEALLVRLERRIEAPPARVWAVVASSQGMRDWLGAQVFEPQPGGRVLIDCLHGQRSDGTRQRFVMFGVVTTLEAERELAFGWQEFNVNDLTLWPASTTVSVTLTPLDSGRATQVALSHSGFDALPNAQAEYDGYARGWAALNDLDALAKLCAAHTGDQP